ncbi:GntR family transcriptional regulator [Umezawaea tangerina]|uniref:GntR family transcriptional regulator n=1 Tax=Umezawaea tangerina TaxID=84725 RepID=A0A2T0SP64_9PSEU|nr:GntR family transcriptional regulator [Umezawaea tangerina]
MLNPTGERTTKVVEESREDVGEILGLVTSTSMRTTPTWTWWTEDDDQVLVMRMPHPVGTVVAQRTVREYGHTVRVELKVRHSDSPVRPETRGAMVMSTLRTRLHRPVGGRELVVFANAIPRPAVRMLDGSHQVISAEAHEYPDGPHRAADPVRAGIPEDGRVPRYYHAKTRLLDLMQELGQGAPLPPERELSAQFGIARMTLRQAIGELVVEGKVRRKQGSGTFVAPPKLVRPLGVPSRETGTGEPSHTRRLVTAEQLAADAELAHDLDLDPGDPVIHIERLMLVDDEPMSLESSYLSAKRFPDLIEVFDAELPLLDCLRDRYFTIPTSTDEQVETVLASPREARLLATTPAAPMLLLHRITRDPNTNPVERVRALFRGDRYTFEVRSDTTN